MPKTPPPAPAYRAPLVEDPDGSIALWPHRPERYRRMTHREVYLWEQRADLALRGIPWTPEIERQYGDVYDAWERQNPKTRSEEG